MANTDNPFGFKLITPVKTSLMQIFAIQTNYATSLFRGDSVGSTGASYVCSALEGETRIGAEIQASGAAGRTLGVVMACFDENMLPITYYKQSVGNSVVGGYLLVNVDPDAEYLVQEDGDTTPIAAADIGMNCDAISTHNGDTTTGQSKMELDSTSEDDTVTLMWKVIRSWPGDTVGEANCRFVVKLNAAFWDSPVVGL